MSAALLVERRDGVAVLTVSNPPRRNALTPGLSGDLAAAVTGCERDESIGALVVTGAPPAFCAGADLDTLAAVGKSGSDHDLRRLYDGFLAVARCSLPTVAAVTGPAVGAGLNLALACDVRLAGPAARFDARFLALGIHPGGGMTWMLQRAIGPPAAAAMMLFNEVWDGAEAVRIGLAHRLVDSSGDDAGEDGIARDEHTHELVVTAAVELAARAARAPRDLVLATKRTMQDTAGMAQHASAVEREAGPQLASLSSPAFTEIITARHPDQGTQ
ncbi:MAG: enoyl-CoA hydratase [Actinomycetota bacterium]|nr:enoyl-CoA hydratase [Actinomycetota bacterium]